MVSNLFLGRVSCGNACADPCGEDRAAARRQRAWAGVGRHLRERGVPWPRRARLASRLGRALRRGEPLPSSRASTVARRELNCLLHRLRLLLLLPILVLQHELLRLCRRNLSNCHNIGLPVRASCVRCRLSRSETVGRTARSAPDAACCPAAPCGATLWLLLGPTMWKCSPGAFLPVGCCWPRLGSILGCRLSVCADVC